MKTNNEVYIPTCLAVNKNTKYWKRDAPFIKFTIWLKEDTDSFGVIDYCYTKRDLKIFGPDMIEKAIIHHFQNHRVLLYPYDRVRHIDDYGNPIYQITSDFDNKDHLVIRDIYYPKDMELPPYC